jgi:hypothetical protein
MQALHRSRPGLVGMPLSPETVKAAMAKVNEVLFSIDDIRASAWYRLETAPVMAHVPSLPLPAFHKKEIRNEADCFFYIERDPIEVAVLLK